MLGGLGCPGQELQRGAVRCCAAVRCLGCVRRERFAIVGKRHSEREEAPGGNKAPGQEVSERVFCKAIDEISSGWLVACVACVACAHMASAIEPRPI